MRKQEVPEEVAEAMASPGGGRWVEPLELWLPSVFMRGLERWAAREGTTPAAVASRRLADAVNLEDLDRPAAAADPPGPRPAGAVRIGPRRPEP